MLSITPAASTTRRSAAVSVDDLVTGLMAEYGDGLDGTGDGDGLDGTGVHG